jgi:hypothetical protein
VAAVGDEVEHEAELAQLLGEAPHLLVAHARRVPVERRREIVGEHLVRELRVDRLGEDARRGGRPSSSPSRGCRRTERRGERLGDRVVDAAAHLVVAVRRLGVLAVPDDVTPISRAFSWPRRTRRACGEREPLLLGHRKLHPLADPEAHHVGDRLAVRLHVGLRLPEIDERLKTLSSASVDGQRVRLVGDRGLHERRQPRASSQASAAAYSSLGGRIELVAAQLLDPARWNAGGWRGTRP